ncbi:ferrochelatase [Plasmodium sp. DRC-Itaito]|nr:ferrochelatase [Plasmodium sp. DRC-Itaito]
MDVQDFLNCNKLKISKEKISNLNKSKIGILITNLGSPEKLTYWSLYKYLSEFLTDPRVVKLNRFLWLPILYTFVLPFRTGKVLSKYKSIWLKDGSPLCVNTHNQFLALKKILNEKYNNKIVISYGMRYGERSIKKGLEYLQKENINKLLVLPLYPQSAECTVSSTLDCIGKNLKNWSNVPELRFISGYCLNDLFINTMKENIENYWSLYGKSKKLIISYHSLPIRNVIQGDLYPFFCIESTKKLVKSLNLNKNDYILVFQSKIKGEQWIKPCIEDTIIRIAKQGYKQIDIVSPSFSSDCLETLEEIKIHYQQLFRKYSNGNLRYINCLNDTTIGIKLIMNLIEQNIIGWV